MRSLCAAAAVLAVVVANAAATTTPGVLHDTTLVIRDHEVILPRDRFTAKNGIPHYPRGADVRYEVRNRGTRTFSLNILGSTTGKLAPGKRTTILVYWSRRGKFVFRAHPNGPTFRIWVV